MDAKGKVFKYGDNIDTDVIIPARYLNSSDPKELAKHCMEDAIHSTVKFVDNVKEGDIIVLTTSYGEFTYKAAETELFKDTNNSFIAPTADDRLTLYTCYGNLLGPTEDRFAVICELVEKKFYE